MERWNSFMRPCKSIINGWPATLSSLKRLLEKAEAITCSEAK